MLGQLRQGGTRRLNRHLQSDKRARMNLEFSYTRYEDTSYSLINLNETTVYFDVLPVDKVRKINNLKKISISITGLPEDTYATDAFIEIDGVIYPKQNSVNTIRLYNTTHGVAVESVPNLEINATKRFYYTPTLESVNIPYITILGEEYNAYYVKANYEGIADIDMIKPVFTFRQGHTGSMILRTTDNRKLQEDELKNLLVKVQIE